MTKDATPLPMPAPHDPTPDRPHSLVNCTQFSFHGKTIALNTMHASPTALKAAKPGEPVRADINGKFEMNAATNAYLSIGSLAMARDSLEHGLLSPDHVSQLERALRQTLDAVRNWRTAA